MKPTLLSNETNTVFVFQGTYIRQLVIHVTDNTEQVFITAKGQGEEALLEFCPSVLELGPCLPFSVESKSEVTVKNLSSFPIEFYCLEFDTQYIKEEEVALFKDLATICLMY